MRILEYALANYFKSEIGGPPTRFYPRVQVEDKKIIFGPLYHIAAIENLSPIHIVRALSRFLNDNNGAIFSNKEIEELLRYYMVLNSKKTGYKQKNR